MTNAQLRITAAAIGRKAQLRADRIQTDTLIQLARILAEGDTGSVALLDALEDLGKLAATEPRDGELDAALDDVATLARLGTAAMDLTPADVQQLAVEAADAVNAQVAPAGTVSSLFVRQDRRAS